MAHAKEPSLNERLLHALILVLLIMMTGSKNPKSFVLAHRIVRSNRICDPFNNLDPWTRRTRFSVRWTLNRRSLA